MKKTMETHLSVLFESVYSLALNASIEANKFKCSFSDEFSVIVLDFEYITDDTIPVETYNIAGNNKEKICRYSTFPKHAQR